MVEYESIMPYVLMKLTLLFELIAFLTSHMVDSRTLDTLHEGLFQRCIYPSKIDPNTFSCMWWSADTFGADRASLQFVTVLAFISIFLLGFTILYSITSYYYPEMRGPNYTTTLTVTNSLNAVLLLLIVIVYTFVYAGDTKLIPGSSVLVFSWSYYLLFAALATNILSAIFFMYNYPSGRTKQ